MVSELNKLRVEMLEAQAKRDSALIVAISNLANKNTSTENQKSRSPELIRETISEKETRTIESQNQEETRRNRILRDALLVSGAAAATSAVTSESRTDSISVRKEYLVLDSLLLEKIGEDSLLIDSLQNRPARIDTVIREVKNATLSTTHIHESYFEINQDELNREEKEKIKQFIADLPLEEDFQILLKGFADNTGSLQYNLNLIEKRVKSVEQFLIEELKIDTDQILTSEGGLVQRGSTSHSRDEDRRVEIRVFKNEKESAQ